LCGRRGRWCQSAGWFIDELTLLIDNAGLRRRLGCEARLTIARSYTLELQLPRVLNVVRELVA